MCRTDRLLDAARGSLTRIDLVDDRLPVRDPALEDGGLVRVLLGELLLRGDELLVVRLGLREVVTPDVAALTGGRRTLVVGVLTLVVGVLTLVVGVLTLVVGGVVTSGGLLTGVDQVD